MVETVSQFKKRVQRLRKLYPEWREGQACWNAMLSVDVTDATPEQMRWSHSLDTFSIDFDPFHDDRKIPALIAAALKAGVLREDDK